MAHPEKMPKKVREALIRDPEAHRRMSSAGGMAAAAAKREKADQMDAWNQLDAEKKEAAAEFDRIQAGEDILPPSNID